MGKQPKTLKQRILRLRKKTRAFARRVARKPEVYLNDRGLSKMRIEVYDHGKQIFVKRPFFPEATSFLDLPRESIRVIAKNPAGTIEQHSYPHPTAPSDFFILFAKGRKKLAHIFTTRKGNMIYIQENRVMEQGKGNAARFLPPLMQALETEARKAGAKYLVTDARADQVKYYKELYGFKELGAKNFIEKIPEFFGAISPTVLVKKL